MAQMSFEQWDLSIRMAERYSFYSTLFLFFFSTRIQIPTDSAFIFSIPILMPCRSMDTSTAGDQVVSGPFPEGYENNELSNANDYTHQTSITCFVGFTSTNNALPTTAKRSSEEFIILPVGKSLQEEINCA